MTDIQRRKTHNVLVGQVGIGSNYPVAVQSMTNTNTADIHSTVEQITDLVQAGSDIIRITVNNEQAAKAVESIRSSLHEQGIETPLVGDFHFNGHQLLSKFPKMAAALDKYRINPGNIGQGLLHDEHFETFIRIAMEYEKPVRIGVNSGSLDPDLLEKKINQAVDSETPDAVRAIICDAMVDSALSSAQTALELGLKEDNIIISAKMSNISDMITVYRALAGRCSFPLHLGLTEAGSGLQGIIASSAALSILLKEGIGDTIRVSLTPDDHTPRSTEVNVAQHILQALGIRYFMPTVVSCPGCGRTSAQTFLTLAASIKKYILEKTPEWKKYHPGIETMTVAVMGCVVNGPGESKHADIGISLPGDAEEPAAPVYIRGKKISILRGTDIEKQFIDILEDFIKTTY